jgi:hypothetical protein
VSPESEKRSPLAVRVPPLVFTQYHEIFPVNVSIVRFSPGIANSGGAVLIFEKGNTLEVSGTSQPLRKKQGRSAGRKKLMKRERLLPSPRSQAIEDRGESCGLIPVF